MKISNIFFKTSILLLTIGIMFSCSDSFLDEVKTTALDTDHFKTQEGLDEMSIGIYTMLQWPVGYSWAARLYNIGTDEFTRGKDGGVTPYNDYNSSLNSTDGPEDELWDAMYGVIESCNVMIKNVPVYYDNTNSNYNTRLGEGYFFRAYYYFALVRQFGGVPLKLYPSNSVETYFTRNSAEECYAQIISDFEEAYDLLPTITDELGRITQSVSAHFLAKAKLFRASEINDDWNSEYVSTDLDDVIKYANEVIAQHPLANNYVDLWNFTTPDGPNELESEIILSAQFSDDRTTAGRFGNRFHTAYTTQYDGGTGYAGLKRDISGGRGLASLRPSNYTIEVFDRVNDSRFWKSFTTTFGCNYSRYAPTWTSDQFDDMVLADGYTVGEKRFVGGELGMKFIVNDAGDDTYTQYRDDLGNTLKDGKLEAPWTYVRYFAGESHLWIGEIGNSGSMSSFRKFIGLSKFRDGSRETYNDEKGTRDLTLARSAEDYLMIAEAYIRKGEVVNAIPYFNALRTRAAYKDGEDRSVNIDGGVAYRTNSNITDGMGGHKAGYLDGAAYWDYNTYYESNNIAETTAATNITLSGIDDIINSEIDKPIYDELGVSGDDLYMAFLMNERTRELCGEMYRWEDLARTNLLGSRWNAFNDGSLQQTSFDAKQHIRRPIPQSFLDGITNANGKSLSDEEKSEMQNYGY
ncbi:RagB/SusD family nutrient uptake outer membrane protein [Plebeiibacterium marinum]|uniref:RagB/SusD family nutrient uptake outer membrane protein n=1 Tax=Plebeiibacterium marinum TaxID=2992111 RepID=A0AAE3SL95_9BACT|nr:RagB/SusD family nutrient uptake outer membrane protein [Plebeiobacterium marinum]MCW3807368.1 RagB/SusD family nutrient uptake outer membrane protein [Plebeiobacterium marinum]